MGNRIAYFINEMEKDEEGNYITCIATEGESGYWKTDCKYYVDIELARNGVDELNERMGIDKKEAMEIVLHALKD